MCGVGVIRNPHFMPALNVATAEIDRMAAQLDGVLASLA